MNGQMQSKSFWFRLTTNNRRSAFLWIKETIIISVELHQSVVEAYPSDVLEGVDDALIETLWHELDRRLPRERVGCVVAEVALGFQNASVKIYLPIFIHRRALDRLRQELNEMDFIDNGLLDEQG